jgi:hypothetical protein
MQYITDSKQINLSSYSATTKNGSLNSSLYFNLNNILKKEQDILYNLVSVVHCEIPVSFYIINSTNNGLRIKIGSAGSFPYTLKNGNYNASSFRTMLLSILPTGFTLTLNSTTGIFTFGYTSSFQILPTSSTCYKLMGFVSSTTYTTDVNNQIIMPYQCNFLGITRLKIKSSIIQTNNLDSYSKGKSNMLCSIPVNNASFGLIIYNNISQFKTIYPNSNLDYIDISITDDFDNLLDFNGIDIYITLQIDTIRKHIPDHQSLLHLLEEEEKNQLIQ